MGEYNEECLKTFLEKQEQLFDESDANNGCNPKANRICLYLFTCGSPISKCDGRLVIPITMSPACSFCLM